MNSTTNIGMAASQVQNAAQGNLKTRGTGQQAQMDEQSLRKACAGFEGMFLEMMMKTMRNAEQSESSFIKKSNGEKIFTEMLDQQYVDIVTKTGANGIGEVLFNHLKTSMPQFQDGGNNFPSKEEMAKMRNLKDSTSSADLLMMNNLKKY